MLTIATLHEPDGRWTAEILELPEILAYGDSRTEAVAKVEALTLRLFADRLEHGHDVPEVRRLFAARTQDPLPGGSARETTSEHPKPDRLLGLDPDLHLA